MLDGQTDRHVCGYMDRDLEKHFENSATIQDQTLPGRLRFTRRPPGHGRLWCRSYCFVYLLFFVALFENILPYIFRPVVGFPVVFMCLDGVCRSDLAVVLDVGGIFEVQ